MTRKAVVTGVAGLVGSHVAAHLLAHGWDVVGVDNLSGGDIRNVPEGVALHLNDCEQYETMEALFHHHRPTHVFHFAAYAAEGLSPFIRSYNYRANAVASANLISCAMKYEVERFVFTSSMAVYGEQPPPFDEAMRPDPVDPYGIAKYGTELDLACAKRTHGLDYTIFRPHNLFGKHQNVNDPYRNVVGIFMKQVRQGRPMTVFGDGTQVRAFSYIDDVAPVIAASALMPQFSGETVNIGGDVPYTILDLAEAVAEVYGVDARIDFQPERDEVHMAYCRHEKLDRLWGPRSYVPLMDGLERMKDWLDERGIGAPTPLPCAIEVERGLPPKWRS